MDYKEFNNSTSGRCMPIIDGNYAFMPNNLPPKINYDDELIQLISEAHMLIGELSGSGRLLPNPYLLIGPYIKKEAVASSRIEGTQADIKDLILFEGSEGVEERRDVREIANYVRAMDRGLELLKDFPITIRLIREINSILLENTRGRDKSPGELRIIQNWIGTEGTPIEEAKYVPPPANMVADLLAEFERYLNFEVNESPLIQCALMHYQFEAIHPFLDGNGRVGRLLIPFLLCSKEYLSQPLLYLSPYFETNRQKYYDLLLDVSKKGDWNSWFKFFLKGVIKQARDAIDNSEKIVDLHQKYMNMLNNSSRPPQTSYKIIDELFYVPIISISRLSRKWELDYNQVKRGTNKLVKLGIIEEYKYGKTKTKMYNAKELNEILFV